MANEPKRPNELTVRPCNDVGLLIEKRCRLPEIRFYPEGQRVMFWAVVHDKDGNETEALQYLTPEAAMKFAKAMEACAIAALKSI